MPAAPSAVSVFMRSTVAAVVRRPADMFDVRSAFAASASVTAARLSAVNPLPRSAYWSRIRRTCWRESGLNCEREMSGRGMAGKR